MNYNSNFESLNASKEYDYEFRKWPGKVFFMESKSESDSHTLGQSHWSLLPISLDLAHSQLDLYLCKCLI